MTGKSVWPLWSAAAALSFAGGIGFATYFLRLRDRERLRHATSRTMKSLRTSQRALAPRLSPFTLKEKVIVVGAGNFGTAMAYVAAFNGHQVIMFMRDQTQCDCINEQGYNPKYLSNYKLDPNGNAIRGICTVPDLKNELETPGVIVFLALPCQKTPDWIREHRDMIPPNVLLCSTAKGLYLPTKQLVGHAILDALERTEQPLAFLSGPSFAEEILKEFPTSVTVASDQLFHAVRIQKLLSNSKCFLVYTSQDSVGKLQCILNDDE
jgi:glycerol-3-phosphate dehydrogenase (NAD+)